MVKAFRWHLWSLSLSTQQRTTYLFPHHRLCGLDSFWLLLDQASTMEVLWQPQLPPALVLPGFLLPYSAAWVFVTALESTAVPYHTLIMGSKLRSFRASQKLFFILKILFLRVRPTPFTSLRLYFLFYRMKEFIHKIVKRIK